MSVILETTKGDLTVDLYIKERPKSEFFTLHVRINCEFRTVTYVEFK